MSIDNKPVWPGWETVRLIGRGSFGAVYEIERDVFGDVEKCALKHISIPQTDGEIREMQSEGLDEQSITQSFADQAREIVAEYKMMARLNDCPNVVTCHDVDFIQKDGGYGWDIFIRMELLTPLMDILSNQLNWPEEKIVRMGKDICNALVACRQKGILHRDIKPQNIFVAKDGKYKLGDFGIARIAEKTSSATARIGTYTYMAPEVYAGEHYGQAADIYSLGMVLYWLLNDRKVPFVSVNTKKDAAQRRRFMGEQIPAPAHGSEELKRIVLKACAFDPKDRYQSADEMLADFEILSAASKKAGQKIKGKQIPRKEETVPLNIGPLSIGLEPEDDGTTGTFRKLTSSTQETEDEKTTSAFERSEKHKTQSKQVHTPSLKRKLKLLPSLLVVLILAVLAIILLPRLVSDSQGALGSTTVAAAPTATAIPTSALTPTPTPSKTDLYLDNNVGDIITFGKYEQDNNTSNGTEPVEWIILKKEDDRVLVISKYALDCLPYNTSNNSVSWETCSLRNWLNGRFLNVAFSEQEKTMIMTVTVSAEENPNFHTVAGNDTKDRVFLLSISEANGLLCSDEVRQCVPTAYAVEHGAWTSNPNNADDRLTCWWWLRTPGNDASSASLVDVVGAISEYGSGVNSSMSAVRPVMWIDLSYL